MNLANGVLALMWIGVTLYAVFAGADFGAGFWDLVAGGARRGAPDRTLIAHRIGPVWEANHVWLIFVLVVFWTGFPRAFAPVMSHLYVPLTLAAVGIILRGAGFAFRNAARSVDVRRVFGATFALSSVLTPFFLGASAGAVASGRVPADLRSIQPLRPWIHPTSLLGGALAVATCAYLAAAFLAADAARLGDTRLLTRYRARGVAMGIVVGLLGAMGAFVLRADAPRLFAGLRGRALPLVIVSVAGGLASIALLRSKRELLARPAAVVAVVGAVWAWAAAQYPDILIGHLTIDAAAGSHATLAAMFVSLAAGSLLFGPPLVVLLFMHSRGRLE
jgi:cytochrome d ubiquinol oxidase subunit II